MYVSSPTETRQGIFAALLALPVTVIAIGGALAFTGFVM